MANELTISASLEYSDDVDVEASASITELLRTLTTKKVLKTKQSVGTSEEALIIGDISTRAWCMLINRDPTNFINVKVATGGAIFAKLLAGEFCLLRLGSGAQSPFVIADTASCELEIVICDL
jgi:hypothetical protein